jgi:hypothetical protein
MSAYLLADVEAFIGRFVAHPSEHARVAHTLWIAHTHFMHAWDSTPRIAFLSPGPGSGKTRALEVTSPLVPRPVQSVNATPAYLFRKVADPDGPPTILYDEIDTVFGPKAKDNEDVRGLLNAGHRRGAFAGRCVVKGKVIETEELPAYCAVALAGLNDLPDTIMSRSVVIRMRKRAPGETVGEWRPRLAEPEAHALRDRLAAWAATEPIGDLAQVAMPDGVHDRDADVWEALLAVADAAGGRWPERARVAAVALVADAKAGQPSLGVHLLADLRTVFGDAEAMSTDAILKALHDLEESPWADLRGKPLDARGLASRLRPYDVRSKSVRLPDGTIPRGYTQADLCDAWQRYLPVEPPPWGDATSATGATNVADVADARGDGPSTGPAGEVLNHFASHFAAVEESPPVASHEALHEGSRLSIAVERVHSCSTCRGVDFWTGDGGRRVCRRCHPPANGRRHAADRPGRT